MILSGLALLPAMFGPLPAQAKQLAVSLCGGGTLDIPLGGGNGPTKGTTPCCAKGCHSGQSRKRLDRSQ